MNIDRHKIFHGLREPINDPFINPIFYITIGAICLAVLICVLQCLLGIGTRRSYHDEKKDDNEVEPEKRRLITDSRADNNAPTDTNTAKSHWWIWFTFTVISAIILARVFPNVSRVNDKNTYYACKDVIHGVAKGNTWPIPSCFEDETTSSHESQ